jgi:hypothetical protein
MRVHVRDGHSACHSRPSKRSAARGREPRCSRKRVTNKRAQTHQHRADVTTWVPFPRADRSAIRTRRG